MTLGIPISPNWMERSGEGYTCICPQCGTICRTVNPTGASAEMYCTNCNNGFRIEFLREVVEKVKE